ncbi:MAG: C25 family cysteine peptidase, partial [Anaerolineae bacterium]
MKQGRIWGILALLIVIVGAWFFYVSALPTAADSPQAPPSTGHSVQLLQSDAEAIRLSVDLDDPTVEQVEIEGRAYDRITLDGFVSSAEAGKPQVPTRRVLLGIPPGAEYEIHVSAAESTALPGEYDLPPAPTPVRNRDLDPGNPFAESAQAGEWAYLRDDLAYAADGLYPASLAGVADEGFIRNQRFIALQLYPLQYNPVTGQALFHRRFTVEVRLVYPHGLRDVGTRQPAGQFEELLASSLLNYESAMDWRGVEELDTEPGRAVPLQGTSYKIMIDQDGIYQVTRAELEAAGVPVSTIATDTFKLYYQGQEVPIRVFEAGGVLDYFWFYGQKETTKFTDTNVYWLTYGGDPGLRMAQVGAPLSATVPISTHYATTVRLEEDVDYRSTLPWSPDSDHWFWDYTFYPGTKPILDLDATLHQPFTGSYSATLKVAMVGYNEASAVNPDHCVRTSFNGQLLDEHLWDGNTDQQDLELAFDAPLLLDGLNLVRVEGCVTSATADITFYDWFEIDFRRAFRAIDDTLLFDVLQPGWQYQLDGFLTDTVEIFDVSQVYSTSYLVDFTVALSGVGYAATFFDASALAGDRYLALTHDQFKSPVAIVEDVPSTLADPANQANYIVIAPGEFMTDIQPLVDYRSAGGLDVFVADLEDVYDEFSFGVLDPEAIRDFLSYAYHAWTPPAPTYVLLVGDGHLDFKNHNNLGRPNILPPYLAWIDPWLGETAADNRYVAVAGADILPDMYLGRLPAESAAELQAMVGKTISYEVSPAPGAWNQNVVFVTDDYPDAAGNFYAASD